MNKPSMRNFPVLISATKMPLRILRKNSEKDLDIDNYYPSHHKILGKNFMRVLPDECQKAYLKTKTKPKKPKKSNLNRAL